MQDKIEPKLLERTMIICSHRHHHPNTRPRFSNTTPPFSGRPWAARSATPSRIALLPVAALLLSTAGLLITTGCSTNTAPAQNETAIQFTQAKSGVPQPGQTLFASPEEAAGTLKDAVAAGDRHTLEAIFGSEGDQLIFTGDPIQENNDMKRMSAHMTEYLNVDHVSDTTAVLRIGQKNWPFPIPVVKSDGGWFFDTVAGRDELLNRRIGEDELNAIAVCRAYVAAQIEYASKIRTDDGVLQYAQHIRSTPGKKDGLFWEIGPSEEISPLGPLVAQARSEDYATGAPTPGQPHPYKGYLFHILKAQGDAAPGGAMSYLVNGKMTGGFALVAWPSAYGASGIMTFIVGKDGKVYQKNFGDNTADLAKAMAEYNPDATWEEVKD
jgi:hypothetical protein